MRTLILALMLIGCGTDTEIPQDIIEEQEPQITDTETEIEPEILEEEIVPFYLCSFTDGQLNEIHELQTEEEVIHLAACSLEEKNLVVCEQTETLPIKWQPDRDEGGIDDYFGKIVNYNFDLCEES